MRGKPIQIFTGWLFVYRPCAQSGSSLLEPRRHLRVALARRRAMPRVQRLLDHHERRACNVRAHEEERREEREPPHGSRSAADDGVTRVKSYARGGPCSWANGPNPMLERVQKLSHRKQGAPPFIAASPPPSHAMLLAAVRPMAACCAMTHMSALRCCG